MKPTLLVLKHGGPSKARALRAAGQVANLIVVDDDPDPPKDLLCEHLDDLRIETVVEFLQRSGREVDGVLTFVDPATARAAALARRLGLPSLDPTQARLVKDKLEMRRSLASRSFPQPHFTAVRDGTPEDLGEFRFPAVLKPSHGAYGLGITRVARAEEIRTALDEARARCATGLLGRYLESREDSFLLEEWIPGIELSIEVWGHPTAPQVLAIHEKTIGQVGNSFREERFVTAPWTLGPAELDLIESRAASIVHGLGFDRGIGNLEARWNGDQLMPLELQLCPAGGRVADMVLASHGLDLHALHAQAALEATPSTLALSPARCAAAMDLVHSPEPGSFRVDGIERVRACPNVVCVGIPRVEGTVVDVDSEYLGFVVAQGPTPGEAIRAAEEARGLLSIEVTPNPDRA
ncbi:MAG: ATP-grasp domain-containing protein [Planctomycetota bacterium]